MSRRLSLDELRRVLLYEVLDDQWKTATLCSQMLGFGGGFGWYKVALVLERLAADGAIELKTPGSRVRKFRRWAA